jgi:hypothetical protein
MGDGGSRRSTMEATVEPLNWHNATCVRQGPHSRLLDRAAYLHGPATRGRAHG